MKSSEQFEAWWNSAYADSYDKSTVGYVLARSIAWTAWQASRAAVEVELTETFSPYDSGDEAMWIEEVEKAIRAAGIKVKE